MGAFDRICATYWGWWYHESMSATITATIGPKGRMVVPQEIRTRRGWHEGSVLVFAEDNESVRLMTAAEALQHFRSSIAGVPSPVDELIAERRAAARKGE